MGMHQLEYLEVPRCQRFMVMYCRFGPLPLLLPQVGLGSLRTLAGVGSGQGQFLTAPNRGQVWVSITTAPARGRFGLALVSHSLSQSQIQTLQPQPPGPAAVFYTDFHSCPLTSSLIKLNPGAVRSDVHTGTDDVNGCQSGQQFRQRWQRAGWVPAAVSQPPEATDDRRPSLSSELDCQ